MDTKGILDSIKGIKNADKNELILSKTKGTLTSSLIGGGLGFLIAKKYNHNLFFGVVIGAMIAGFATTVFIKD